MSTLENKSWRTGAVLRFAARRYLRAADLRDADLSAANLREVREDYFDVLSRAPSEVVGLLAAIREGRIAGDAYQGPCACLVGTIANLRHEAYTELSIDLRPNSGRPSEIWFLHLREGDTPANSPFAKVTEEWTVEWLKAHDVPTPPNAAIYWRGDVAQFVRDIAAAGIELDALVRSVNASQQEHAAGLLDRWAGS